MAKKDKKRKKHRGLKFLFVLFVIIIFAGIIYLSYLGMNEVNKAKEQIEETNINIDEKVTSNITLPTKINDEILIIWESSNENIIKNDGTVTQPTYLENDANITLTMHLEFHFKHFYTQIISNVLLNAKDYDQSFLVIVPKKEASSLDVVKKVSEELTLPSSTYYDLSLPKQCYWEGVDISWQSNNSILSSDGIVTRPNVDTEVELTATISYQDISIDKSFNIIVLKDEFTELELNDTFDELAKTSQYKDVKTSITYHEARILIDESFQLPDNLDETETNPLSSNFIRLRTIAKENKIGGFDIPQITNPLLFSFKYRFYGTQTTVGSSIKIIYTIINNDETQEIIEEIPVEHIDDYTIYQKDLSSYNNIKINITYQSTWQSATYLDIDQVTLSRKITPNEMIESFINNLPTNLSNSYFLPTTTPYGGIVSWTSSEEKVLSSLGYVNIPNETTSVILTGKFTYLNNTYDFSIEIKIKGLNQEDSIEIYFIDIGKYGASDCGEVTYIKYGNMDILVDAGDHFDSTKQAVEEAINSHLEDGILEYVIATHPDSDHIGGMANVFAKFNIQNLIKFEGENYTTQKFLNMKKAYEEEGCNVYNIYSDIIEPKNNIIEITNDIYLEFIDTTYLEESTKESNGKSIVFVLNAFSTRLLMTGDADNGSGHTDLEEKYMNKVNDIDILKVVHHGTSAGCDEDFLKVVDPEVAIVCNGNYLGNKHGHPHADSINNLYQYDRAIKIYAICGGGTIDGEFDQKTRAYRCSSEERFIDRNGTLTLIIQESGYEIHSELNDKPIEFSNTTYWKNNPAREFSYQNSL